ncbi:MAG: cellulase family glycosylhydrolase [Clostridia bacterium]
MEKKKLRRKVTILILLALLVFITSQCSYFFVYAEDTIINESGYVKAHNTALYDGNGNKLLLKGVNAGNLLLQEGWMSVTEINGSYEGDFCDVTMMKAMRNNPNLTESDIEELLDVFYNTWWKESDFDKVKEIGLNCIRLPFAWNNLMNSDYTLKEDCFNYLDWFIDNCARREIYVLLDLHAVPGSQNGQDHSGDNSQAIFFDTKEYMDEMVNLWTIVATHYKEQKYIMAYDILNEPQGGYKSGFTDSREWNYFDRLYKAIRSVDSNHIVSMCSCWEFANMPNPARYGWTNVMYQFHYYNWPHLPAWVFHAYKQLGRGYGNFNIPMMFGEFTCFDKEEEWTKTLDYFDSNGWSWAFWSYKSNRMGSWGLYELDIYDRVDVATASKEEIARVWGSTGTENAKPSVLYDIISNYMAKQNKK